jgi:hypothetical protein
MSILTYFCQKSTCGATLPAPPPSAGFYCITDPQRVQKSGGAVVCGPAVRQSGFQSVLVLVIGHAEFGGCWVLGWALSLSKRTADAALFWANS